MPTNNLIKRTDETLYLLYENGYLVIQNFYDCECGRILRRSTYPTCPYCGKPNQGQPSSRASDLLTFASDLLTSDERCSLSIVLEM